MTSDAELVKLKAAHSIFEAERIVGALKGLDIEAVTFGGSLADEFAMSRKLMGAGDGIQVMVRHEDLERAKQALAEIKDLHATTEELENAVDAAARESDEDGEDDERAP